MNKPFQEILETIAEKEIEALTEGDIAFIKARESYLNEEQLEKFKSLLNTTSKKNSKKK